MMDGLIELQKLLPGESASFVISSLKRDPLLWNALGEQTLLQKVSAACGENQRLWSPASLALAIAGCGYSAHELAAVPMIAVEKSLRQKAGMKFEEIIRQAAAPGSLADAALLAVALRERRRLKQDWNGFANELFEKYRRCPGLFVQSWRTPLACLFHLVPDPEQLLVTLVAEIGAQTAVPLAVHVVLTNPISFTERLQVFTQLCLQLTGDEQVHLLFRLRDCGESGLVCSLACWLLEQPSGMELSEQKGISPEEMSYLTYRARLHRFSGQDDLALTDLSMVKQSLINWLSLTSLEIAGLASGGSGREADEVDSDSNLVPEGSYFTEESLLELVASPKMMKSIEQLNDQPHSPYLQLDLAKSLYDQGEVERAVETAHKAVARLAHERVAENSPSPVQVFNWEPARYIQNLIDMGLLQDALQLALLLLEGRPADEILIDLICRVLQKLGDIDAAINMARTAVLLFPDHIIWRRLLGRLLEQNGEWEKGFAERNAVVAADSETTIEDWEAYVNAAIRSGRNQLAADACAGLLEQHPNHGALNASMGKALFNSGQKENAVQYLSRAILLVPEQSEIWLHLADCYLAMGEQQRALETLRAAALAAPDSPEINFRLARACLDAHLPSEALPFLKKAARLTPGSYDVSLELGNTLGELGHLQEARQVLGTARQRWANDPDLALAHAQVLLDLNDPEAAIPVLEVATTKEPPEFERYLLYAKTLVGDWHRIVSGQGMNDYAHLVNAQQALVKALELRPEDFQAHLMMAEVLGAKGTPESAYEIYQGLVEDPDARRPEWRLRVQGGFGWVALQIDQVETALAALQDATQSQPENVYFQRLLAEACLAADLKQEALQAARYAHRLAPDDIDILSWFAGICVQLNAIPDAMSALQTATELVPEVPDFWLRLAGLHLQVGNLPAADEALDRLLGIENLSVDQYRQAAYAYLRMQAYDDALPCLEKAVDISPIPDPVLLFELAQLFTQLGRPEDALNRLDQAIENDPQNLSLYVFQSDLYSALERSQAAIACLEHAAQLLENRSNNLPDTEETSSPIMQQDWINSYSDPAALYSRFGVLHSQQGEWAEAILNFERALDDYPDDISLRCVLAVLYRRTLSDDLSQSICGFSNEVTLPDAIRRSARMSTEEHALLINFCGIKIEHALENNDRGTAEQVLQLTGESGDNSPRLICAKARLAARNGEYQAAANLYSQAVSLLGEAGQEQSPKEGPALAVRLLRIASSDTDSWLADTALEVHAWSEALEHSRDSILQDPCLAGDYFHHARRLVEMAETQALYADLGCGAHAPGNLAVDEDAYRDFIQTIQSAASLAPMVSHSIWYERGEAAFHPTLQNISLLANAPRRAEDTAALMLALRRAGNPAAAVQVATEATAHPAVMIVLALCLQAGSPEHGVEIAKQLVETYPPSPVYYAVAAGLYEKLAQDVEALAAYENALSLWPEEAEWQIKAALISERLNEPRQATAHLEAAVKLQPENFEFALMLARAYLQNGLPVQAVSALDQARYFSAMNAAAWMVLATAHWYLHRMKDAEECASRAAQLDPSDPQPLLLIGTIALDAGRLEEAQQAAYQALGRDPLNAEIVLFLAQVLYRLNRKSEALQVIVSALPTREESIELLFERARLVYELNGAAAGLPFLHELAEKDPENAAVLALLGRAEVEGGEIDAARDVIQKSLRIDPEQPELNRLMGKLQRQTGQLDQAVHYFSEAVRQSPVDLESYMDLADTYMDRREHQQALKVYQQAIKFSPDDHRPYYASALIMRECKDYVNAEAMLRKAAKLAPEDINIRRQLGAMIALNLVHNAQEVNSYR